MSAPTTEEELVLIQFRDRVKDVLETEDQTKPGFLIRWLRARNHDLDKAEKMLRSSLEWRKTNGIDHILETPLDAYFPRTIPFYIKGHDKYGHPIVLLPVGKWNLRKYRSEKTDEQVVHYCIHCYERIFRAIKDANKDRNPDLYPITQMTMIADFKDFSYMQVCSLKVAQGFLHDITILEAHYPETEFRSLLINAPYFINVVMAMLKSVFPSKTYEKFSVYGSNREVWITALQEIIDDDQLQQILKLIDE